MQDGVTVWISGPAESPKDELAQHIEGQLLERGLDAELIEDDFIWCEFGSQGQRPKDNEAIVARRTGLIASMLTRNRAFPVVSVHVPSKQQREKCFEMQSRYVEVLCTCCDEKNIQFTKNIEALHRRAVHELPFEPSDKVEIEIDLKDGGFEKAAHKVIFTLELLGILSKEGNAPEYDPQEAAIIRQRLEELGYI